MTFPDVGHGECSDCQDDNYEWFGGDLMPTKVWEWVVFVAACLYLILLLIDLVDGGRVG